MLGQEEGCCGDSARRAGNEYLFMTLAQTNIETFKNYNVKKIVTTCPHGYNCLKNEYPQFEGGTFEVYHFTELVLDLIKKGRIKLNKSVDGIKEIAYHDSCFLGRYNELYDQPREIIKSIPGTKVVEFTRNQVKELLLRSGGSAYVDGGDPRQAHKPRQDAWTPSTRTTRRSAPPARSV